MYFLSLFCQKVILLFKIFLNILVYFLEVFSFLTIFMRIAHFFILLQFNDMFKVLLNIRHSHQWYFKYFILHNTLKFRLRNFVSIFIINSFLLLILSYFYLVVYFTFYLDYVLTIKILQFNLMLVFIFRFPILYYCFLSLMPLLRDISLFWIFICILDISVNKELAFCHLLGSFEIVVNFYQH